MEKEEGLQLLLRSSGGDTDEVDAVEEILDLLGNLPLAIDQARAYTSKRRLGLRAFLTEYKTEAESHAGNSTILAVSAYVHGKGEGDIS